MNLRSIELSSFRLSVHTLLTPTILSRVEWMLGTSELEMLDCRRFLRTYDYLSKFSEKSVLNVDGSFSVAVSKTKWEAGYLALL